MSVLVRKMGIDDKIQEKKLGAPELAPKEMTHTYTALIRQSEGWWIGWIQEVRGVTCQERTRNELLDALKITLREILEFDTLGTSDRTESEAEKVKVSDILEFGTPKVSNQMESGFEEVSITL